MILLWLLLFITSTHPCWLELMLVNTPYIWVIKFSLKVRNYSRMNFGMVRKNVSPLTSLNHGKWINTCFYQREKELILTLQSYQDGNLTRNGPPFTKEVFIREVSPTSKERRHHKYCSINSKWCSYTKRHLITPNHLEPKNKDWCGN